MKDLDDDGEILSYIGRIGEGSHWLMANQAGWNTGQMSYTHRPQSVRSQLPHTGQNTHNQGARRGTVKRNEEMLLKIFEYK